MYSIFTISEAGGHPDNEDAFEVSRHPQAEDCLLCTLGDGQGGRAGGAAAARIACKTALEFVAGLPVARITSAGWVSALMHADQAVHAEPDAGFTTLIGFAQVGERLCGASAGDSAIVAIDDRGKATELSGSQQKNPPVGSSGAVFRPYTGKWPWKVLAMSDGVWKYVGYPRIVEVAADCNGQEIINTLVREARTLKTGALQDDFTLIVLQRER